MLEVDGDVELAFMHLTNYSVLYQLFSVRLVAYPVHDDVTSAVCGASAPCWGSPTAGDAELSQEASRRNDAGATWSRYVSRTLVEHCAAVADAACM